jgi:hypothetical protein
MERLFENPGERAFHAWEGGDLSGPFVAERLVAPESRAERLRRSSVASPAVTGVAGSHDLARRPAGRGAG